MFDVQGSQVAPSNFNLIAFPLSKSFDEGIGTDVVNFNDLDRCNYITSSFDNSTNTLWNLAGGFASGSFGTEKLDVIDSGMFGSTFTSLISTQSFKTGRENLKLDVTKFVSGSMCGFLDNYGFLIAYSGSEETDTKSRFVKRFASRHTKNPYIRPRLRIEWDSSIIDYHNMTEFNNLSHLYLWNYHNNIPKNLVSGSNRTELKGANCLKLKIDFQTLLRGNGVFKYFFSFLFYMRYFIIIVAWIVMKEYQCFYVCFISNINSFSIGTVSPAFKFF